MRHNKLTAAALAGVLAMGTAAGAVAPASAAPVGDGKISISEEGRAALGEAGATITGLSGYNSLAVELDEEVARQHVPSHLLLDGDRDFEVAFIGRGYSYNEDRYDVPFEKNQLVSPNAFDNNTSSLNLRARTSYYLGGTSPRYKHTYVSDDSAVDESESYKQALIDSGLRGHNPDTLSTLERGPMGSYIGVFAHGELDPNQVVADNYVASMLISEPVFVEFNDVMTGNNGINAIGRDGWFVLDGKPVLREEGDWLGTNVADTVFNGSLSSLDAQWFEWRGGQSSAPTTSLGQLIDVVARTNGSGQTVYDFSIAAPVPVEDVAGTLPGSVGGENGRDYINYNVEAWQSGAYSVGDLATFSGSVAATDGKVFNLETRLVGEGYISLWIDYEGEPVSVTPRHSGARFGIGGEDNGGFAAFSSHGVRSVYWGLNALDDSYATSFNTPVETDILANDFYDNGREELALPAGIEHTVTGPAHGGLTDLGDGKLLYTPADGFSGVDTFPYTITLDGVSRSATVSITVAPGEVVVPEEPQPPVTPEEPTQPEEPVTPEEPQEPVTPEQPAQPTQPQDPQQPEQPAVPGEPVSPGEPAQPVTPEEPGVPVAPPFKSQSGEDEGGDASGLIGIEVSVADTATTGNDAATVRFAITAGVGALFLIVGGILHFTRGKGRHVA